MDVADVMREQNYRDRFRDLAGLSSGTSPFNTCTQNRIMWTMSHWLRPIFPSPYFTAFITGTSV